MNLLDKLKANFWMVVALALTAFIVWQHLQITTLEVELANTQRDWAAERSAAATAVAKQHDAFRQSEHSLANSAAQDRKTTNEQVRALTARNADLLERVRRAERSGAQHLPGTAATPDAGGAGAGSDGGELLGTLGEEDVREANRADTIRLHLAACYRAYHRAEEALRKLGHE